MTHLKTINKGWRKSFTSIMLDLLIITCSQLSAGGLTFVQCGIRGMPGLLLTQTARIKGKCSQRPATLIPKPATHTLFMTTSTGPTWTGPLEPTCPHDRQKTEGQLRGGVKNENHLCCFSLMQKWGRNCLGIQWSGSEINAADNNDSRQEI